MIRATKGVVVSVLSLVAGTLVVLACEDDPHRRTSAEQLQQTGGACQADPGKLPEPNCDNSDKKCDNPPGCAINEAKCGSKSTCLPIGDNKGKDVLDFRMRRLNIAAPAVLAGPLIQNTVVTLNIDLEATECGELGKGLFTWLLRVDKKNNRLITGGAPPSKDPFGEGFCFAAFQLGETKVQPIDVPIAVTGDTFRSTGSDDDINIPIFLNEQVSSAIILPISKPHIEGVTISADGNCIGKFNLPALDNGCFEILDLCQKWQTAGSLGGYITPERADGVRIKDLNNKSLCAFLASDSGETCVRDGAGKVVFKGDYCSTTDSPGGCADSVWLAATFAASAAKVFDGKGKVEACSGQVTQPDGGADAGDAGIADAADGG